MVNCIHLLACCLPLVAASVYSQLDSAVLQFCHMCSCKACYTPVSSCVMLPHPVEKNNTSMSENRHPTLREQLYSTCAKSLFCLQEWIRNGVSEFDSMCDMQAWPGQAPCQGMATGNILHAAESPSPPFCPSSAPHRIPAPPHWSLCRKGSSCLPGPPHLPFPVSSHILQAMSSSCVYCKVCTVSAEDAHP